MTEKLRFDPPDEENNLDEIEGTVIIPSEEGEYPYELFAGYVQELHGGKEAILTKRRGRIELDVEGLAKLIWEHQQYQEAQEFAVSQLHVLQAVQNLDKNQDVILTRHISEHRFVDDYSDSVISTALTNLVEEGLLASAGRGEYEYTGFETWMPEET